MYKLTRHPAPNFEGIIYDEQDRTAADPSSNVGWYATQDDAVSATMEYVADTAGLYRAEVRDRTGKLVWEWNRRP